MWPASFRLFACLDFDSCPFFPFLSFSWVLSFYEVWQGFIIIIFLACTWKSDQFQIEGQQFHAHSIISVWKASTLPKKNCTIAFYSHKFLPKYYCKFGQLAQTVYTSVSSYQENGWLSKKGSQDRLLIISIRIEQKPCPFYRDTHRDPYRSGISLMNFLKNDPQVTRIYCVWTSAAIEHQAFSK